jgi:hypothetical protein
MVLDPKDAKLFIAGYTSLLAKVHLLTGGKSRIELLEMLTSARGAVVADPSLIATAASSLEAEGKAVPEEVLTAVQSLRLRRWVYLRDTTKYSIFLDPEGEEAYAVLGLTDRLRDIVGGTGVILQTGLVHFQGRYVCDGLIAPVVWLGSNYRRSYSELFATLKKSGHFHVSSAA